MSLTNLRLIATAMLLFSAVFCFTACTPTPCCDLSDEAPDSLVLIAAAHQNAPAADIPIALGELIESAVNAGAPITVIALDGTPAVWFRLADYEISEANEVARENDIARVRSVVLQAVRSVEADSDGNDLGAAFGIAADQVETDGAERAAVIAIDNGLSDRGFPIMTDQGVSLGDAAELVAFAQQEQQIVTMPIGTRISLVGFGYTAPPQPDLSVRQRDNVTAIWVALLSAGGADVEVVPAPRVGPGPDTNFATGIVTPAEPPVFEVSGKDGVIEAELGADVLFDFGSAALREDADIVKLRDLVEEHGGSITITAHTDARGDSAANQALSQQRGDSVREALISEGVDESRITVVAVGENDLLIPDATTEAEHQANRRVVVTIQER